LSIEHAANAELFAKQRPSDCSSIGSTISLPARSRSMALHKKRKWSDCVLHIDWRSFIARPTKTHALTYSNFDTGVSGILGKANRQLNERKEEEFSTPHAPCRC
jgi:hypothetical protein